MNDAVVSEDIRTRRGRDSGRLRAVRSARGVFCAFCEATFGVQDVPRA